METVIPPNLFSRSTPPPAPQAPESSRSVPDEALWGSMAFGKGPAITSSGDISASFEAALQQAEGQLESFVQPPPPVTAGAPVATAPVQDPDSLSEWVELPFEEEARAQEPAAPQGAAPAPVDVPVPPPAPAPVVVAPVVPPPAPPVAQDAQADDDEQQLALLIEKRFADVQSKQDHFSLLGLAIGPDVKREQVKTAFLGLAKRFHPDRLPPSLSALAPRMSAVYEAIRDAYDVLYDDAKRAAYLQELRSKATQFAPRTSGEDPNEFFKAGEIFLRKRDFAAAADHFDRAFQNEPRAVFLAARAWAIYMDPQRKAEATRAKQMMTEALRMDPQCDRAHYQLGVIARVEGDVDRAERHFREAIRLNPKHLEANQELRLIEMRKKNPPPPPPKKGGLFR